MDKQIVCPEDLTPERMTSLLRRQNLLDQGRVVSVNYQALEGQLGISHMLYNLKVQYADAGPAILPYRFFLKFGKSWKEGFFYETISQAMPAESLLRCFYTGYESANDLTCLLFEDVSETYHQTEWPLPPSSDLCSRVVRKLASIHAHWWQHPRLEMEFRSVIPPGRSWRDRRALALERLPDFLAFLGDRISPSRRSVYERLLASPVRSWEIPPGTAHQTLLHGDLHAWNVFYPYNPSGELIIFDWNMWDIGRPTDDLAYFMAVHWYPERRARLEPRLLEIYYEALVNHGVSTYAWDDYQRDYRRSVIRSLMIPVWQWAHGIQTGIWWSHLERVLLAFEDLNGSQYL